MAGVPIEAYLHWTLYDNWEWGSYEPRFGLYATERPSGQRLALDSMGEDAAATYREIIATLRPRAAAPAA
jgi:beta-glucosidase